FDGVHVVPMDGERVLEDHTVLVADGVVQAMGARGTVTAPDDALVIEGNGRYLLPGLAEMHGHLPNTGGSIPERWRDDVLFLYLANGVTLVRGMQGNAQHLELRDAIARGELLGPRLYVASPQMSGQSVRSPGQGIELVDAHRAAGFDLLKIQEGLQSEVYAAIAERA